MPTKSFHNKTLTDVNRIHMAFGDKDVKYNEHLLPKIPLTQFIPSICLLAHMINFLVF